ncbi:MAG: alpha-amylase family glycosyl hydrolase [Blautia sp.]|jgi:isoamylase
MEGIKKYQIYPGNPRKMGAWRERDGCHFAVCVPKEKETALLLYPKGKKEPCASIPMPCSPESGDVRALFLAGFPAEKYEYNYLVDGEVWHDPYARSLTGREEFGQEWPEDAHEVRAGFFKGTPMTGDVFPELTYEEMILYKVHVRGYTKQKNSKVKKRGTFTGLIEKIPYWKELGVNAIELMPAYDFMECRPKPVRVSRHTMQPVQGKEQLNFWGYTTGYYYAPKRSYCAGRSAEEEFKELVLALHAAGMECIMEFYFDWNLSVVEILDILHFWRVEYHVDGFHLIGCSIPQELLIEDPLLSGTKLFFLGISDAYKGMAKPGYRRRLAEYNGSFAEDMRCWMKSDEGMIQRAADHIRRNPSGYGVINYITVQDGFTLADLVSYDFKHNEANGEDNEDGSSCNYSWNCGVEGPSRKQSVRRLRKKQMRNAWLLLLFSQGTPLIYGGDEFGNSQNGNNNAYCQDNETGWVDWSCFKRNEDMVAFVKAAIAFRRAHPILHMEREPKGTDYRSVGCPDISFHSQRAWYAGMENTSRCLGVMYCCAYGEKTEEKFLYFAYNFHWEPKDFALPNLPEGCVWQKVMDTSDLEGSGFYEEAYREVPESEKTLSVPPRSIVVLTGK